MASEKRSHSFDDNEVDGQSTRPLLDDEVHSNYELFEGPVCGKGQTRIYRWTFYMLFLLLANLTLLGINCAIFSKSGKYSPYITKSPASHAAAYLPKNEHATSHSQKSPYSGHPNEENIKAWEDLIEPTFFAASAQELIDAHETVEDAVELAEGGYVAAIGVYHEIHCLRQLRLFLYSDVFYPNLTAGNIRYLQGHLDHCLETLRMSLMCSADLSLYSFTWDPSDMTRPKPRSNSERMCVDWGKIENWANQRKVPIDPILKIPHVGEEKIHL